MCLAVCRVPCARSCSPPRTRVSTEYKSAFAGVRLQLDSGDAQALPAPLTFTLATPSTVRISAMLTVGLGGPVLSPPWTVKATAAIAQIVPGDSVDTACTQSFTVFDTTLSEPEVSPAVSPLTLAAVRTLPPGDYLVSLSIEATHELLPVDPLELVVGGELDVVVVCSALGCALVSQEFAQRTDAYTAHVAIVSPFVPLTPLTTPGDFSLMHESCVLVTAPLSLTLPHLGDAIGNTASLRLFVSITAAPGGDSVYLSDAALTRSLYTGLDVGTYTVDVTPTALTTLPRGTYTVQILGAIDNVFDTIPVVLVTVSGDVNVLAVRTRISGREL